MWGALPSLLALGAMAAIAVAQVRARWSPPERIAERRTASRALAVALAAQALHFWEEAAGGLHTRLPALFGLAEIPFPIFVGFNVLWLGIWVASIPALRRAHPVALFAAWFLAIGGAFNGVAHPLLAIVSGGYFPGVGTSTLAGAAAIWLWTRLDRATRPRSAASRIASSRGRAPATRRDP